MERGHRVDLNIEGMTCASCVNHVERALAKVDGVGSVNVNLATGRAHVELLTEVSSQVLVEKVERAGYGASLVSTEASPTESPAADARAEQERSALARRFKWSLGATLPLFVLEMGSHVIPAFHHWLAANLGVWNWIIQAALTTWVMFGPGRAFFTKGLPALMRMAPDMNSLVAIGSIAAWGYSLVATFMPSVLPPGTVNVYYEAAAVIITLILLGRLMEARARSRTSDAIRRLAKLQPQTVFRLQDGKPVPANLGEVQPDDLLLVRPGERIPLDGLVTEGNSYVDESAMTGEPMPVGKSPGSEVIGGTLNTNGALTYRVTRTGADTLLSRIIQLVESAQASKLPIQAMVDRITGWFVPGVLLIAAATFIGWFALGPEPALSYALVNAVAVLIIACPCAMGLATPTSIMVGTGRAATMGLLFRQGAALQSLAEVKTIAFDKTGTLTEGKPRLTDFEIADGFNRSELLALAAAAEQHSEHPIATALVEAAQLEGLHLPTPESFQAVPGFGLKARVAGRNLLIGADRLLTHEGIDLEAFTATAARLAGEGKTPVYLAVDGRAAAVMAMADTLKPGTANALQALHQLGFRIAMISGDNKRTALTIAKNLGIDEVIAEVLPDEKVTAIKKLRLAHGPIAYVGDGINDAPALAEADLGMAIGTGTDVAIESADLVLVSGDLQGVPKSIALARATMRNIKQNLFWAFAYNIALIPLAAGLAYPLFGILLSPMFAAGAMALSSVFVVTNALRLRTWSPAAIPQ